MIALLAALTLLVLAGGSLLMLIMFLANSPYPDIVDDSIKGMFIATRLAWPLILALTGAFGIVAFLAAGQPAGAFALVLALFGAYYVVRFTLQALTASSAYHLPLRGVPALLCILLFLGVNAAAVYSAWHLVFGPA